MPDVRFRPAEEVKVRMRSGAVRDGVVNDGPERRADEDYYSVSVDYGEEGMREYMVPVHSLVRVAASTRARAHLRRTSDRGV